MRKNKKFLEIFNFLEKLKEFPKSNDFDLNMENLE